MENMVNNILKFYKDKKVFVTGHTGFKGSWLCKILIDAGANVTGYSLSAPTDSNLFSIINIKNKMNSVIGDIRDLDLLKSTFEKAEPEIVFHLAAQPLVRDSYKNPRYTYETNVMGTVNILECIRLSKNTKSFLNITTDKVYKNNEWEWGYRENEPLDGFDPYSNSKSCSELVTHSYKSSFFNENDSPAISTARAGNVIGGGDFALDRIIPDCVRSIMSSNPIIIRNPNSIRPYQHVLESLYAYLMIAKFQYLDKKFSGNYNVGPDDNSCITTGELVKVFEKHWGKDLNIITKKIDGPHEANFLKLDCSKLKKTFNWAPKWNIDTAVKKTVEWTRSYINHENIIEVMNSQILEFFNE